MTKREVICSLHEHCLSCPLSNMATGKSCPLSNMATGKSCRELTQKEIKEILNRKFGVLDEAKKA